MQEDFPFEVSGSKIVYQNPWMTVREDAIVRKDGRQGIYGVIEVGDSVAIVAADEQGRICLVESYRHPAGRWVWEIPGGGGDGEKMIIAARRELEEETGIVAQDWHVLGKARIYSGLSTEQQTNLLATNLTVAEFTSTEDETRARKFVSLAELDAMIAAGELDDNQSIAAIYMYKSWLQANK